MGDLQHSWGFQREGSGGEGFLVEAWPDDGDRVEIRISGEVDLANVARFAENLAACVTVPGSSNRSDCARRYVVDMSAVSFIGVDGARVIVGVAADLARRGSCVEIQGVSRIQRRIIELVDDQGVVATASLA